MQWPPPQFDQPAARRGVRVFALDGQPYVHAVDVTDWMRRTMDDHQQPAEVRAVVERLSVEIRRIGDVALDHARRAAESEGELAGRPRPEPGAAGRCTARGRWGAQGPVLRVRGSPAHGFRLGRLCSAPPSTCTLTASRRSPAL